MRKSNRARRDTCRNHQNHCRNRYKRYRISDILCSLFNLIYESGQILTSWLQSIFITLPQKLHYSQCDDYRMISLMSHVLKTFLGIIHTRIYRKCEDFIGNTQFIWLPKWLWNTGSTFLLKYPNTAMPRCKP
jgi:hypothetical protein